LCNSQADSAGSIPVTRSKDKAQVREILPDLGFRPSALRSAIVPVTCPIEIAFDPALSSSAISSSCSRAPTVYRVLERAGVAPC
jgi:hypothetical protein